MSQPKVPEIILYHYTFSPYAQRVVWYLNLRKIPYTQCLQPPYLPRPDMKALGTNYRRIPILSIGRDIYNDTRLILQKLESFFPPSSSYPALSSPSTAGLAKLFEIWSIVGGLFRNAGSIMPTNLPLLKDPKFQEDRKDYTGTSWGPESIAKGRPAAMVEITNSFEIMETLFLGDGRKWLSGGAELGMVDLEAVWLFIWMQGLPGALPKDFPDRFPKTFAWTKRFGEVTKKVRSKPKTVKWAVAKEIVKSGGWAEVEASVQGDDPTALKKGAIVEVWPTDSGFNHRDKGELVGLNGVEVVVKSKMEDGTEVRVHAPRHGFRVREVKEGSKI